MTSHSTIQVSSQGKPFGAVQVDGIAFVTDAVMVQASAAYQAQALPAYRRQLPLVVGRLGPGLMADIQALNAYDDKKPAFVEFSHDRADSRPLPDVMTHQMARSLARERAPEDIRLLAAQAARLVGAIAAFDAQHFGAARGMALRLEHGVISQQAGLHVTHQSGVLHRDAHGVPMADGWREYLVRTTHPAYYVANAATESVPGKISNTATLAAVGANLWRPLAGEVVLIAAGTHGTFHASHRPTVAEGRQASFLLRMIQMP